LAEKSGTKSKSRSSSSSGSRKRSSSSGSSKKRSSGGSSQKRSSGGSSQRSNKERPMREVAIDAVTQVQDLIGRPVESVTGIEKNGKEWTVTLEVLELERIPNTTDVLGVYEVTVDKDGDLTGARRTRRFFRSEAGEG
jgi:Gas vesicle synthesis protein GvpO